MQVAVLLSPGVTAFEALGPYAVFRRLPGAEVHLVADRVGRVPTQGSKVALIADTVLGDDVRPDVLVVPGGIGIRRLVEDRPTVHWVREAHAAAQRTLAVSTGSVLLAAAGALDGDATTHWLATDLLEERGVHAVSEPIVRAGDVLTATGALFALEASLQVVADLVDPTTAARIRDAIDPEDLGPLDPTRTVEEETLVTLAGPDDLDPDPVYVLGGAPPKRRRRSAKGRIEILFAPAPAA
jgi:putative intracellular protease/amidase